MIEFLRKLHNKSLFEKQQKIITRINAELRKREKSTFTKLTFVTQLYLVKLAISEFKLANRLNSNPTIEELIEELESFNIYIKKSTLSRWISNNFTNIREMYDQINN